MTPGTTLRTALVFALAVAAAPAVCASTENTPTPYTKCAGWLDRDDVHNFRTCFFAETKSLIDNATRWHNYVVGRVQHFRDWPRSGGDPSLLAAENCQRTREMSASLATSTREAQQARQVLVDASNTLRTMHGQITQHASFRMRNREGVRDTVTGVATTYLDRLEGGIAGMVRAEEYLRSLRVAESCGQVERQGQPDTYEHNVNYMGGDIGRGMTVDTVEACNWFCTNNANCRGFTFVRTGPGGRGTCWLKHTMANRQRDACCISRIVRR